MKKRAWSPFLMWVMVIWLYGLLSIAAASKSNATTFLCDASLEDCLSASHFRRILANSLKFPSEKTMQSDKTPFISTLVGYKNNSPDAVKGPMCKDKFQRPCHFVDSS